MSAYKYAIESLLMERQHLVQSLAGQKEAKKSIKKT